MLGKCVTDVLNSFYLFSEKGNRWSKMLVKYLMKHWAEFSETFIFEYQLKTAATANEP